MNAQIILNVQEAWKWIQKLVIGEKIFIQQKFLNVRTNQETVQEDQVNNYAKKDIQELIVKFVIQKEKLGEKIGKYIYEYKFIKF